MRGSQRRIVLATSAFSIALSLTHSGVLLAIARGARLAELVRCFASSGAFASEKAARDGAYSWKRIEIPASADLLSAFSRYRDYEEIAVASFALNICCATACVALWCVLLNKNEAALAEEEEEEEEDDEKDDDKKDDKEDANYADYVDGAFALYDYATADLRKRKVVQRNAASQNGLRSVLLRAGALVGAFALKNRNTYAGVRGGAIAHPVESYAVVWFVNLSTAIATGITGYAFTRALSYDLRCAIANDGREASDVLPYTSTLRNMGYAQCALSLVFFLWALRITIRPQ